MVPSYLTLAGRIQRDLADVGAVVERVAEGWRRARSADDDLYVDSVALNLHGFYAGLERIFELIAREIDGSVPTGPHWHVELLRQMSTHVPRVRDAVLQADTAVRLDTYRGFRHVVRNVYTFNPDAERVGALVAGLPAVFEVTRTEIGAFTDHLEGLSTIDDSG